MRIRAQGILEKIKDLDEIIDGLKVRLSGNLTPPEIREVLSKELNDLMVISMFCKSELADCFDLLDIKLKDL
tara:strand:- start:4373 stop:4588 length:216 start_codon:yes stop_codon:yes gene_type:complete